LNICVWVLFVWARESDNLDAPYRASELVLLNLWHLIRSFIGKKTSAAKAIFSVLHHVIHVHRTVSTQFLATKILPYVDRRHALSVAVASRNSVDVNLKLFSQLGRLAMTGHWIMWTGSQMGSPFDLEAQNAVASLVKAGMQLINNNPALFLPIQDEQAIEVALFLILAGNVGSSHQDIQNWLGEMANRLNIAVRSHSKYPCRFSEYQDLLVHPKEASDEYRKDATAGSILIPLIAAWLAAFQDKDALKLLVELKSDVLNHCTMQLWLPEAASEDHIYLNDDTHGIALCDLPLTEDGTDLLKTINEACDQTDGFTALTGNMTGYWPVVLAACRHYRLPIPPQYWIGMLYLPKQDSQHESPPATQ
jgi:hypothetical protein